MRATAPAILERRAAQVKERAASKGRKRE